MNSGLLVLVLLGASGSVPPEDSSPELTIFFSGFVEGTFGPCGCDATPTGGLSRRKGYSEEYSRKVSSPTLHVDAGNYFFPPGPWAQKVNPLMLRGLDLVPIRAVNLAPGDLFFWKQLASMEGVSDRFISTNLYPRDPSVPKPRRYRILTVSSGELGMDRDLRVGFLGVSDPTRIKPNSGFAGDDPVEAVGVALEEIRDQVDLVVVLADIRRQAGPLKPDSVLYRIAAGHPEIKAILCTEKQFRLHEPEQVHNAVILSSVERGRYLGLLKLSLDGQGQVQSYDAEFVELKEGVREDPELFRLQSREQAPY